MNGLKIMETNNKLRIVFLDFDGVITWPGSKWNVDSKKVAKLEEILKATGAKIVISSSWRVGCKNGDDFVNKMFTSWRANVSREDKDSLFIKSIIDVTDSRGSARGNEIQRWLDKHEDEVESYVILDDDNDMLEEQLFNFVQTDCYYGMSERTVALAIQVLNNEKIANPIRLNQELIFKWRLKHSGYNSNIEQLLDEYYKKF